MLQMILYIFDYFIDFFYSKKKCRISYKIQNFHIYNKIVVRFGLNLVSKFVHFLGTKVENDFENF